jgi:hypothetical protein
MKMDVEKAKTWAEFLLAVVSIVAIPVAAWWAYTNFTEEDTHALNPNITVSAETLPYDDDRSILVVHSRPKNVGKVPFVLFDEQLNPKGYLSITIKSYPDGLSNGIADGDALPTVFEAKNVAPTYGAYILEPGIDYDELHTFIVPNGKTYMIQTQIGGYEGDAEVDAACVVKVDGVSPQHKKEASLQKRGLGRVMRPLKGATVR